ncbi:MAG: LysM peptidoglycan-binding domain-containing protein [Firmicutes bacterium]|nr:LysM peptidoglycan-binding domain-containing protein [Bacillota bacterium]
MSDEFLKDHDVQAENEEENIDVHLEPCDCEEDIQDQSYALTHFPKNDCFLLRIYAKTIEAILDAQKQILYHSPLEAAVDAEVLSQQSTCRKPRHCPPGFQGRYTVKPGDTMFLIAQRFGVSLQALIKANPHISDPNKIFPCDVLCVPGKVQDCRVPKHCPPGFQGRYTVKPGDTMFLIAQRFGVSLQALIKANPHISDPNMIFPCDVLCVPGKSKRDAEEDEDEE